MDDQSQEGARSFNPPTFQLSAESSAGGDAPIQRTEGDLSTTVTDEVIDHLYSREARRNTVYRDSLGFPTVGVGHLLTAAQRAQYPVGTRVPDAVIDQWLREDSQDAYSAAYQQVMTIGYENQQLLDALTSVNFQNGTAWTDVHPTTWRLLRGQQWENAAREAADSLWFQQTPVRVLDFQRVLLTIAGRPTDYDSMRTFNDANIRKWNAAYPTRANFGAFNPAEHEAPEGGETSSGQSQTAGASGGTTTTASGISGAVGLAEDGTTYVGSQTDIQKVQQLLINAGFLPPTRVNQAGETVSNADGFLGTVSINAIKAFQAQVVGLSSPDGRIDAGGRTWTALAAHEGQAPAPEESSPETSPETAAETAPAAPEAAPVVSGSISGPVGLGPDGTSYVGSESDVRIVQQLLINAGLIPATRVNAAGQTVSNADGFLGEITVNAIKTFQRTRLGFNEPDGRIDPGGRTWNALMGQTGSAPAPETAGPAPEEEVVEEAPISDSEVEGPTTQAENATSFDEIPAEFKTRHTMTGSVGNGGGNSQANINIAETLLQMAGYRTSLLNPTGSAAQQREKRRIQRANCIFHFQRRHEGLSTDARIDPGGATWKKLVEVAYANSGGAVMTDSQLNALHQTRRGTASDVPSDLHANITDGHLLGIDKSGYLLPEEFRADARRLKTALEAIKAEIGNYSISNGYRSPEHNVKIGSTATQSQHVMGIAADIQWGRPQALKSLILRMMDDGRIPPGGAGVYSWGVHYDIRGTRTPF